MASITSRLKSILIADQLSEPSLPKRFYRHLYTVGMIRVL